MSVHDAFLFEGREPSAALLVHGFSGSPAEMRELGQRLAADGHTVLGVRLAGHGGNPADLANTSWRDWLDSVERGYEQLQARAPQVFVCGFSIGGALSVLLARRRRVQRLALLATPARLSNDWRVGLLPVARFVIPWFYPLAQANFQDPALREKFLEYDRSLDLDDPAVQQRLRKEIRLPTAAINQAAQLANRARRSLPGIAVPALVLQGRNDENIPLDSAEIIYRALGSTQKDLVWMPDTGHQLLVSGPHRQAIYERVAGFLSP